MLGRSYSWVSMAFRRGELPTEIVLNDKDPAITAPTLRKYALRLKDRRRYRQQ